jgi:hypothetical protein
MLLKVTLAHLVVCHAAGFGCESAVAMPNCLTFGLLPPRMYIGWAAAERAVNFTIAMDASDRDCWSGIGLASSDTGFGMAGFDLYVSSAPQATGKWGVRNFNASGFQSPTEQDDQSAIVWQSVSTSSTRVVSQFTRKLSPGGGRPDIVKGAPLSLIWAHCVKSAPTSDMEYHQASVASAAKSIDLLQ